MNADNVTLALQANKGLEVDSNGLSLIDCSLNEILKYNGSNQWACATDATGAAATLQGTYDNDVNGGDAIIGLTSTDGGFLVRDNATPLGGTLFAIQNSDGSSTYLGVTASGISVTGSATVSGNINTSGGAIQTNGTTRIDNSGNLTNAGTGTFAGLITANGGITIEAGDTFTFNGDGFTDLTGTGLTISGGALQTTLGTSIGNSEIDANAVALGTQTTGDYITNLGTLTGLSTSGNSGEGSTPTLSVTYGSGANTAVQGNTTLTCPSGTGNLSGGGTSITLGSGGTCGALDTNAAVSFGTSVTTPLLQATGALTINTTATAGADDVVFQTAGTEKLRLLENGDLRVEKGANDVTLSFAAPGSPATYTFSGASGTILTDANFSSNLDSTYVNTNESPAAGDIGGSFSGGLTIGTDAVALGTDTTGNYVASFTAGGGLTGDATGEGSTPTIAIGAGNGITVNADDITVALAASANGLSVTTSSGSGLEVLASGVTLLQGCADSEILKWNETTDVWACASDSTGASNNIFETINAPSGTDPVADSTTDTLNLTVTGTNLTITGNSGTDTLDFDISESTLAGAGLAVNGDALDIGAGTGITVNANDIAINQNTSFTWTADQTWNLNGTEDLDVTSDLAGTVDILALQGTPSASAGTTRGLFIQQADSANGNGLDEGLTIDNADTNLAITAAIRIQNSGGGGYTTVIDNQGTLISGTELNVLDGGLTESEVTGEIEAVTAGTGLTGGGTADSVTLNIASGNGAIVANADDITLTLAASADGLSSTTSSGSGLEVLSSGLALLQGCANNEVLKWNETTDVWACATDATGTASNSFETFNAPAGTDPVADSTTDTLNLTTTGTNLTITGNSGTDTLDFDISESTLAGAGLAVNGDALDVVSANGAIVVGANNITLTLAAAADGLSANTSSGSGLEVVSSGLALLQGCTDGQSLKWNEATDVWACGGFDLDNVYDADTDKIFNIDSTTGLLLDLTTTGNLAIRDGTTAFATFDNTGGITFTPNGTSDITFTLDNDSSFITSGTVTDDGFLTDINLTLGADANVDTIAGLRIDVTSAATGDADVLYGLDIGNLTGADATVLERALRIGTGWDEHIRFDDENSVIKLGAADDTAVLSITDNAATPNTLVRLQDHSTNFGASLEAGAFIDYNSMYVDEFFKDRTQVVADGNQNWGDNTEWSTGETGTCTWDGAADGINGYTSMVAGAAAASCSLMHTDLGAATANTWLDADNLPTIVMKIRPSVAGAGVPDTDHQFFAGMWDGGMGAAPASGAPTNGIYFSNASNTAGTTGTANWYAVTDNGGASTNTACGVAVSETQFALLIIKVMSTSLVKFYIDPDVSNGVSLTECGTGNTANINTAGMTAFMKADWDANSNASTLDVDFFRVWQDDAATTSSGLSVDEQTTNDETPIDVLAISEDIAEDDAVESSNAFDEVEQYRQIRTDEQSNDESSEDSAGLTTDDGQRINLDNLSVGALTVQLDLIVQGALVVDGPATFKQMVRFEADAIFEGDVVVKGKAVLSEDAAGYAKIQPGMTSVKVTFKKPYQNTPIVTLSLGGGKFDSYSYQNVTSEGFEIILKEPATEELSFSWTAMQVESP